MRTTPLYDETGVLTAAGFAVDDELVRAGYEGRHLEAMLVHAASFHVTFALLGIRTAPPRTRVRDARHPSSQHDHGR